MTFATETSRRSPARDSIVTTVPEAEVYPTTVKGPTALDFIFPDRILGLTNRTVCPGLRSNVAPTSVRPCYLAYCSTMV